MFPRLTGRVSRATALALLAGAALVGCTPGTAAVVTSGGSSPAGSALSTEETRFVDLLNAERSSAGLATLAVNSGAASVARSWASQLAQSGNLDHNPNLASDISANVTASWVRIGENVGSGGDTDSVHRAMIASSSHRSNILDSAYDIVGVGVVRSGSTLWMATVFVAI
jgi:uncharacterized protein YkwD